MDDYRLGIYHLAECTLVETSNAQTYVVLHTWTYRVTHLLADLGRVDLDLGCSTGRWAVLQLRT